MNCGYLPRVSEEKYVSREGFEQFIKSLYTRWVILGCASSAHQFVRRSGLGIKHLNTQMSTDIFMWEPHEDYHCCTWASELLPAPTGVFLAAFWLADCSVILSYPTPPLFLFLILALFFQIFEPSVWFKFMRYFRSVA